MAARNSNSEPLIVMAVFLAGLVLRLYAGDRLAVEHFDEGIYSSVMWYDAQVGSPYPARHLYAPPLLSAMISGFDWIPGLRWIAPFLPAICAGAMTTVAVWWLAGMWFGRAAGLFAAVIAGLSDFHIISSRTALTDVPVLLFILLSVGWGTAGLNHDCLKRMAVAGLFCGLAWWTKYTGWLPLAIAGSGGTLWWVWRGRLKFGAFRLATLMLMMGGVAFLTWLPWLWQLQTAGGYAAVAANHRGYLGDFSVWTDRLATQFSYQFWLDGISGNLSVGIGMLIAAGHRWMQATGSTWNRRAAAGGSQEGIRPLMSDQSSGRETDRAVEGHVSSGTVIFPPVQLLVRFVLAAFSLSIVASAVWTPLLLTCLAVAGLSGMYLWPVLLRAYHRGQTGDLSPTIEGGVGMSMGDLACAPRIDPTLGLCTLTAWFAGMLLTTPLYYPYARLSLPLLMSIWIAAAAGVGWWIEANLSMARRSPVAPAPSGLQLFATRLVALMAFMAVAISLMLSNQFDAGRIYSDRTSLRQAAAEIAIRCAADARSRGTSHTPLETEDQNQSLSIEQLRATRMVIYAFAEPAVLFHLNEMGVIARPVSHLNLTSPIASESATPAYLVVGPYAKRTPGFWESWLEQQMNFKYVAETTFFPSPVVLLDLFTPAWIQRHEEAAEQRLEVYGIGGFDARASGISEISKESGVPLPAN